MHKRAKKTLSHVPRLLAFAVGVAVSMGGCDEGGSRGVETTQSALRWATLQVVSDSPVAFSPCCNASWNVVPAGVARFDAVNEFLYCNGATDYIWTANHARQAPFWAGAAFNLGISSLPTGAKIDSLSMVICARAHTASAPGIFAAKASYWEPGVDGYRSFVDSTGNDAITVPTAFTPSTPLLLNSTGWVGPLPGSGGKTPSSRISVSFFGSNIDISQVWFSASYNL